MICPKCNYTVRGGKIFTKHFVVCDGTGPRRLKVRKPGGKSWSSGLTKETDQTLAKIGRAVSAATTGVTRAALTTEHKQKISKSMIIAHDENRAWNIGRSRWNNEPSYPEKFFRQVIENEFDDKDVIQEFSVGRYSIDFAWPHKHLAIEIDGAQHDKPLQIESDKRKDAFLVSRGWRVLRVKWYKMYHAPHDEIRICKEFIAA